MSDTTVQKQLREQLEHLPAEQPHQDLEFARSLVKAKGRWGAREGFIKVCRYN